MSDTQRIYQKLIEVSETVAGLKSSYEEGKIHALDAWKRNDNAHNEIREKLSCKAEREEVSWWIWIQKNPKMILLIFLLLGGGLATEFHTKLIKLLLGSNP